MEDLHTSHDRSNILSLQHQLEDTKQQIHFIKKKIDLARTMKAEYAQEIEEFKKSNQKETENLKKVIEKLEKAIINSNNQIPSELSRKTELIIALRKEIEVEESKRKLKGKLIDISSKNESENILNLQQIQKEKQLAISSEIKNNITTLEEENRVLQETRTQKIQELHLIKDNLETKKEELAKSNTALKTFQKELSSLQDKIEIMKNEQNCFEKQGNSLFSEVEDRSIQLERKILAEKRNYIQLQQKKLHIYQNLQSYTLKNEDLLQKVFKNNKDSSLFDKEIEQLKQSISELEYKIRSTEEDIKRDIVIKGEELPKYALDYVGCRLRQAWEHIAKDSYNLTYFANRGLETVIESQKTNVNRSDLQKEVFRLEIEIQKIKNEKVESELCSNPTMIAKDYVSKPTVLPLHSKTSTISESSEKNNPQSCNSKSNSNQDLLTNSFREIGDAKLLSPFRESIQQYIEEPLIDTTLTTAIDGDVDSYLNFSEAPYLNLTDYDLKLESDNDNALINIQKVRPDSNKIKNYYTITPDITMDTTILENNLNAIQVRKKTNVDNEICIDLTSDTDSDEI